MNAHLPNKIEFQIGGTLLLFKRKKNRVSVTFQSENTLLFGISNSAKLQYEKELKKYNEAQAKYKVLPDNIKEPVPPENETRVGYAYCGPDDEFDMVYGMRTALDNAFKEYDFTRDFRKLVIETFNKTFGFGICKPKLVKFGEGTTGTAKWDEYLKKIREQPTGTTTNSLKKDKIRPIEWKPLPVCDGGRISIKVYPSTEDECRKIEDIKKRMLEQVELEKLFSDTYGLPTANLPGSLFSLFKYKIGVRGEKKASYLTISLSLEQLKNWKSWTNSTIRTYYNDYVNVIFFIENNKLDTYWFAIKVKIDGEFINRILPIDSLQHFVKRFNHYNKNFESFSIFNLNG